MENYAIEMLNITKQFPGIIANDNITLQLKKGEIHALLGENGAGKSTLMSVLFGMYRPEKGVIKKQIVFPKKGMFGINTDMGKFMENLTLYNNSGTNPNDDAPDSLAMFSSEIIEENSQPQKAEPIMGIREFF